MRKLLVALVVLGLAPPAFADDLVTCWASGKWPPGRAMKSQAERMLRRLASSPAAI